MPRTTKAIRSKTDGSLIIESTTTFYGNSGEEVNLTAKETWKVDNEGKMLTIDFVNTMSDFETKGINYYNRVK